MMHPEGGHARVPLLASDPFEGVCPFHGNCLEGLCTNVAIAKRLGLASVDDVPNLGDDHEIWNILGYYLGTFCANLYLAVSVERIIIGGGVMNRACLFDKIRDQFRKSINEYVKMPQIDEENIKTFIVRSSFEDDLGTVAAGAVGSGK
jgi:fructokinase